MTTPEHVRFLREHIGHAPLFCPTATGVVLRPSPRGTQILMQQRADTGCWTLPGGFVEPTEQAADAMVREVLEETGVTAEVVSLLGVRTTEPHTYPNQDVCIFFDAGFLLRPVGSDVVAHDDESLDAAWFDLDALPEHRDPLIERWLSEALTALGQD